MADPVNVVAPSNEPAPGDAASKEEAKRESGMRLSNVKSVESGIVNAKVKSDDERKDAERERTKSLKSKAHKGRPSGKARKKIITGENIETQPSVEFKGASINLFKSSSKVSLKSKIAKKGKDLHDKDMKVSAENIIGVEDGPTETLVPEVDEKPRKMSKGEERRSNPLHLDTHVAGRLKSYEAERKKFDKTTKARMKLYTDPPTSDEDENAYDAGKQSLQSGHSDHTSTDEEPQAQPEEEDDFTATSDSYSDIDYFRQKSLVDDIDFLENFGEIPNVSDVSLDPEPEPEPIKPPPEIPKPKKEPQDRGRFVDPLTGEELGTTPEESSEEIVIEKEKEEDKGEGEDEGTDEEGDEEDMDFEFFDEELGQLDADDEAEKREVKEDDAAMTLLNFFEFQSLMPVEHEVIDPEAVEREIFARRLRETTIEFVKELIDSAVWQSEYVDPDIILRAKLDKHLLIDELITVLTNFKVEVVCNAFINKKTIEFFRRKKNFRPITEDPPESIIAEKEKYRNGLLRLDFQLQKETDAIKENEVLIESLKEDVVIAEKAAKVHEIHLEDVIRKTFKRDDGERLEMIVKNQLSSMAKTREEVSDVRLLLIRRQHTLAALIERKEELEHLGAGLEMRDFEHLQTETQALDKKIEERNVELNRVRIGFNAELHIMAHMKEKQQMLLKKINQHKVQLNTLTDERRAYREKLTKLKLERGKVRKEIRDLSYQGGLLDKPTLMLDYDDTKQKLNEQRFRIVLMKAKIREYTTKIEALEVNLRQSIQSQRRS